MHIVGQMEYMSSQSAAWRINGKIMMCGLPFLVRINVSSCVVFVRIFVEFRRLNVGIYVGEGGYCGDI